MIDFSLCLEGSLSVPLCDPSSEEISPKAWLLLSQSCPEALLPPWFWGHFFWEELITGFLGGTLAVFFVWDNQRMQSFHWVRSNLDRFVSSWFGKYQWCGPTKVMKSHVVRTLDWVDLRDYPKKTMRDHHPDIGRYLRLQTPCPTVRAFSGQIRILLDPHSIWSILAIWLTNRWLIID